MDSSEVKRSIDLAEEAREKEWKSESFAAALFHGLVRWDLVHSFPKQSPEDKAIGDEFIEKVRKVLIEFVDPNEVDRTGELPEEALLALAEIGCFGMLIPREYGGLGLSQTNYNRVISFVASYCNSTAIWLSAHQSIGTHKPLLLFGTLEQKQKYLPRLAKGAVSGFALTEPDVGSDPARLSTTATLSKDGAFYVLNGEKLWCTNGPSAEILIVMALTSAPATGLKDKPQITAFIVETDTPGFEVAHRCEFMGIRGIANGLLRFRDVKVPAENMLGKPGEGLKIALTTLNTGRLTMPSMAAALGKLALHYARDWSKKRVQWGRPIGHHQAIAEKLADMATETFAIESLQYFVSGLVDRGGVDIRLEAALSKYYATERAWRIADDLVQIRGGRGYETAESLARRGEDPIPAERMLRDARIARIIEGTSEIMRLFIAREALDFHLRHMKPLVDRLADVPSQELPGAFLKLLWYEGKSVWPVLRFYFRWYLKQWLPAMRSIDAAHLSLPNRGHLNFIAKASRKLARSLFASVLRFQQGIEREHILLRAYVDIGADLFAMGVILSRAESVSAEGQPEAATIQKLANYFCTRARQRISENVRLTRRNYGRAAAQVGRMVLDENFEWLMSDVYSDFPPQFLSSEQIRESLSSKPDKGSVDVAVKAQQEELESNTTPILPMEEKPIKTGIASESSPSPEPEVIPSDEES